MALSKIKTNSLSDDAVTAAKIADGTIVAADLAANSVDSSELVDGGVDLSHMSVNSIDSDQYVDGSIDLAHLSANSIDSDQYVDGSIDTAHIADLQVTTAKIAADAITAAKIADDVINSEHYAAASIDNEHLADDAVDSDELAAGSVDLAHMSVNSIDSDQYVDGSIDTAHIANDQITAALIADNAIDSDMYVDGSIDTAHIANDQITAALIADNALDSDMYVDGSIDTAHIADDQITLAKMAGLARGKIIYGDSSGNPAALAVGSNGQALVSDGTDISWGAAGASLSGSTNNTITTVTGANAIQGEANLTYDGTTFKVASGAVIIEPSSGATSLTIGSGANDVTNSILFPNDAQSTQGSINYVVASDTMNFKANSNGQRMAITSAGVAVTGAVTGTGAAEFATLGVTAAKDLGTGIHIKSGDSGGDVNTYADELVIENNNHCGITLLSANNKAGFINFGDDGDNDIGQIYYDHQQNGMYFETNATVRQLIASNGGFYFGTANFTDNDLADNTSGSGLALDYQGRLTNARSGNTVAYFNRMGDGGNVISINQAGGVIGTISVSGSTVSYNAFSGSHWSRLADNSQPTILRGTVMESIATMCDWYACTFVTTPEVLDEDGKVIQKEVAKRVEIPLPDGKNVGDVIKHTYEGVEYDATIVKEENEQLPMCKISDTENSKAVYGVFCSWDNEPDDGVNDMLITALGAFVVRIHKDETVAIGDWLVSNGDGTAKKLAGNTTITADVQSSLIGKVTSTTKTITHGDGSYCVPCTLHCG